MRDQKPQVCAVTPAGEDHQVVSLSLPTMTTTHRKQPCPGCPWKKENTGSFPAEAFKVSAPTSYDSSTRVFSCHESGKEKPAICAGFLLRNSEHNLAVRLKSRVGDLDLSKVSDGGSELFESYKEMAIANGVAPDDPVLALCRADYE